MFRLAQLLLVYKRADLTGADLLASKAQPGRKPAMMALSLFTGLFNPNSSAFRLICVAILFSIYIGRVMVHRVAHLSSHNISFGVSYRAP